MKTVKGLTENEKLITNEVQLFHLTRLYKENKAQFYEVCNYFPFYMNINDRKTLSSCFANKQLEVLMELDRQIIIDEGFPLIEQISHKETLDHAISIIRNYDRKGDRYAICSYFQYMRFHGRWQWMITYKMFLTEDLFVNLGHQLNKFGSIGSVLHDILGESMISNNGWQKFQSLTKREKEILKMISRGDSSGHISDQLFISPNTVRTHRQKIMQKIDAKSLRDVIRFTQAFELTGQL